MFALLTHSAFRFRACLALSSALILTLSFPPVGFWVLALVGYIPLFYALSTARNWIEGSCLGAVFGAVYFGLGYRFLFALLDTQSASLVFGVWLAAFVYSAGFWAIGGGIGHWIAKQCRSLLAYPTAFFLLELVRGIGIFGSPIGQIGYALAPSNGALALASVAGVGSVTLATLLANLIGLNIITSRRRLYYYLGIGLVIGISAAQFLYSERHSPVTVSIGAVSLNHAQRDRLTSEQWPRLRHDYIQASDALISRSSDLIIWPETITPSLNLEDPSFLAALSILTQRLQTPILFGSPTFFEQRYYNSAALLSPHAAPKLAHKQRLMPIGEIIPFRSILDVLDWLPAFDYTSGKGTTVYAISTGSTAIAIGSLICLELGFPSDTTALVRSGANLLVTLANSAWFSNTYIGDMMLQMAQFRSAESNRSMIVVNNGGPSASISPRGRIVRKWNGDRQVGILDPKVAIHHTRTWYSRSGPLTLFFLTQILIALLYRQYHQNRSYNRDQNRV